MKLRTVAGYNQRMKTWEVVSCHCPSHCHNHILLHRKVMLLQSAASVRPFHYVLSLTPPTTTTTWAVLVLLMFQTQLMWTYLWPFECHKWIVVLRNIITLLLVFLEELNPVLTYQENCFYLLEGWCHSHFHELIHFITLNITSSSIIQWHTDFSYTLSFPVHYMFSIDMF